MRWAPAGVFLLAAWVANLAGCDLTTVLIPLVAALVAARWAVES